MTPKCLTIFPDPPALESPRLVIGLSGWMDGGDVSTGTIEYLVRRVDTKPLAEIAPDHFYVYNLPGDMEFTGMFRPGCRVTEGRIMAWEDPDNTFWYDAENRLILFIGQEPHLQWPRFADAIFRVAKHFAVKQLYYVGSYAGLVPHTRDPRIFATVSHDRLAGELERINVRPANYEGAVGFSTYLNWLAPRRHLEMTSLVAEIPPYIQGRNPRCIEAMLRRLATLLDLTLDLEPLRMLGDELEVKLNQLVREKPDIYEHIQKLEENYDQELFETDMGDLKDWLVRKGIRLD